MKLCHSEIMKKIKELNAKKEQVLAQENKRAKIRFKEAEKKVTTKYDYAKTRKQIEEIDAEIRRLKLLLAKANCVVMVDGFNFTIGEALVYLAQLNSRWEVLSTLAENEQLTRSVTYNGVVEYTECVYNVETAEKDLEKLESEISRLQVAIDRANLNNYIEV